jgi:hypothetical protein
MDPSSASNAVDNAVDDGAATVVDSAIDSPPRHRPNHRHKRQLSQLTHDDDSDPDDEIVRSYQESTVAHRLVHSPHRVRRRLRDSAIVAAPCIRPNQCLKRQLSQLTHDDDGDPDDELLRSYQESTVAHRLVHSSE